MMDGDMDGKGREIAGRGCLRMTAGEAARVMEWIDRS